MSVLYADTSALVKLYVEEAGSDAMLGLVRGAQEVASSALAWPEALATFARLRREGLLALEEHQQVRARFTRDYGAIVTVSLDGRVLELADRLVLDHPLRGADAVHLASAVFLSEQGLAVRFACSDRALLQAAAVERLGTADPAAA